MRRIMRFGGCVLTRRIVSGFAAAVILVGSMGLECDSDARSVFRQEAAPEIGNGVKTIVNGVLDGWIAAIIEAGDGSAGAVDSGR